MIMAKRKQACPVSPKNYGPSRSPVPSIMAWFVAFFVMSTSITTSTSTGSVKHGASSLLWSNVAHAWIQPVVLRQHRKPLQYLPIQPHLPHLLAALDANNDDTLNQTTTSLSTNNPPSPTTSNNDNEKSGYKFGDFTRSLLRTSAQGVNQLTGKDEYEFGDLTKWMTQKLQQEGTESSSDGSYQFGDLSRSVARQIQTGVANYTGKDTYQVGDISATILSKVQSGEYSSDDLWLALRVLVSAGLTLATPVAAALPTRILLEMINVGLAQEVTGRLLTLLANILDQRLKQAVTGNAQYMLGDITKDKLEQGLQRFTGKESYELGDITRTIQQLQAQAAAKEKNSNSNKPSSAGSDKRLELAGDVVRALSHMDPKK